MKKKIVSVLLTIALALAFTATVFGDEGMDGGPIPRQNSITLPIDLDN